MEIRGGGEEGGRDGGEGEGEQRRDDVDNVGNAEEEQQPGPLNINTKHLLDTNDSSVYREMRMVSWCSYL